MGAAPEHAQRRAVSGSRLDRGDAHLPSRVKYRQLPRGRGDVQSGAAFVVGGVDVESTLLERLAYDGELAVGRREEEVGCLRDVD